MLKKCIVIILIFTSGLLVGCQKDAVIKNIDGASKNKLPTSISTPVQVAAAGTITVGFSPHGGVRELILDKISKAETSINVLAYGFSDTKIAQAIQDAANRGIDIKLIVDDSQAASNESLKAINLIDKNKVKFDSDFSIMHNKVIIIDNCKIFTGSYNYSTNANAKNAENILFIEGNQPLTDLYLQLFNWRWTN